ncbi:hypothetical protein GQ53DRAFT_659409 [Thozetella sp. PMI_491]|nr:hypothetical protein GQ53DRAFT_659409 [Thozetella sp. PMI_491]
MGSKREHDSLSYSDVDDPSPQPSTKRQRSQASSKAKQQDPKTDLTYGQRCVFPGLDAGTAHADVDLDFEDETDALAYLQSVRSEAKTIPHLLVAPKAGPRLPPHLEQAGGVPLSDYQSGVGDSRGYYHDGAYTAVPDSVYSEDDGEWDGGQDSTDQDAPHRGASAESQLRDAYFAALTTQFMTLRARLHQSPPLEVLRSLPGNHETEVGFFGAKSHTFKKWTHRLRYTDPLPAQVAAMDRQSALRLLRIVLGGKFLRRGIELRERTSRWIWALLARLPDRGELDHVEVGWVRELGKRAVLMMVSIAQMAALREEVEGGLDGEKFEGDDDDDDYGIDDELLGDTEAADDGEGWVETEPVKKGDSVSAAASSQLPLQTTSAASEHPHGADGDEDEADMDLDMEDGEVPDKPTNVVAPKNDDADIAAVKARLLAQLNDLDSRDELANEPDDDLGSKGKGPQSLGIDANEKEPYDETRARANMRATLNMILTVAGEFYGQRDLLEFRDPFTGL